jgi:16S rRNA (cytosine1407-C5)-methyltransferase
MSFSAKLPSDLKDADEFVDGLVSVYGNKVALRIIDVLGQDPAPCFWINPLVPYEDLPIGRALDALPDVLVFEEDVRLSETAAAERGAIYQQNPSSYFAASVLAPRPGEEVLDLAAAPGSKTIAMAAMMGNSGRIAAVEPVKARFHRLRANLARCGVTNVQLYQRDGRGVGRAVGERFDRVLLDAPCSSEARMRWHAPATYRHWTTRKVKEAVRKQKSLIRSAYASLKPGGELVYSTCSFAPEENEGVVNHLLERTDAELLPVERCPPNAVPGVTTWRKRGRLELARCVRIVPDGVWDGFFIARIKKL